MRPGALQPPLFSASNLGVSLDGDVEGEFGIGVGSV